MKKSTEVAVVFSVAVLTYLSVASAPFLYDDNVALLKNPDVQGKSSLADVWLNDFWGTRMNCNTSHKSYRPITVLVFRWIHLLFGNWSTPYHVINILLHATVSSLFLLVCRNVIFEEAPGKAPVVAGVLFALHPVHTEAVSGVVGMAELLSAFFFMLSFYLASVPPDGASKTTTADAATKVVFSQHHLQGFLRSCKGSVSVKVAKTLGLYEPSPAFGVKYRGKKLFREQEKGEIRFCSQKNNKNFREDDTSNLKFVASMLFALFAMLSKESGVTVLVVIAVNFAIKVVCRNSISGRSSVRKIFMKLLFLCLWAYLLMYFRLWMMNWRQPEFAEPDNRAAHSKERLTRFLTYSWLCCWNFWLLLCPLILSYDWSYNTIPLVTSLLDARNIFTLIFCILLICGALLALRMIYVKAHFTSTFIMGYTLMIVPFIPASNLLFPVGFVIAERVLYLPSFGFIILFVIAWQKAKDEMPRSRRLVDFLLLALMVFYGVRTVVRNQAWCSKEAFMRSGVQSFPQNAKMHYNWGNYLNENNQKAEAAAAYERALKLYPAYVGAMNNLATILEEKADTKQRAVELYARVIQIQPTHANAYKNLADLLIKRKKYDDAIQVLARATKVLGTDMTIAGCLARALTLNNKVDQAERIYRLLLKESCTNNFSDAVSDSCANANATLLADYAQLLEKKGQFDKALIFYQRCEAIDPTNAQTLVLQANTLLNLQRHKEAGEVMTRATDLDERNAMHLWSLAATIFSRKNYKVSLELYKKAIEMLPNNLEVHGQYAAVLFEIGQRKMAENQFVHLLHKDEECKFDELWRNLATLYGRQGKYAEGIEVLKSCVERIVSNSISLSDEKRCANVRLQLARHEKLQAYRKKEFGDLQAARRLWSEAIHNLEKALKLDPSSDAVKEELRKIKAA